MERECQGRENVERYNHETRTGRKKKKKKEKRKETKRVKSEKSRKKKKKKKKKKKRKKLSRPVILLLFTYRFIKTVTSSDFLIGSIE